MNPREREILILCMTLSVCMFGALISCTMQARAAEPIIGQASVIDGDTIEIHGIRIRLWGIDAPEHDQPCVTDGQAYRCGQKTALSLSDRIGRYPVTCDPRGTDRYGRTIAVCGTPATSDLSAWMVSQGWALAFVRYSKDYVREEKGARNAHLGIWSGTFETPWLYRQRLRSSQTSSARSSSPPTEGCVIKGNINRRGDRIFHVPGQEHYRQTVINPAAGERWFCSAEEAEAAGWRAAMR